MSSDRKIAVIWRAALAYGLGFVDTTVYVSAAAILKGSRGKGGGGH